MGRYIKPITESRRASIRKARRTLQHVDIGRGGAVSLLRGQNRRAGQQLWLRKP